MGKGNSFKSIGNDWRKFKESISAKPQGDKPSGKRKDFKSAKRGGYRA